jgi:magnesium chelatase family protein
VLEALRQPLETGSVLIARASRTVEFPANFHLVCAANPCPCGYRGHPKLTCKCSPSEVWRYRRRISGPLLDRMDLRVELAPPGIEELAQSSSEKQSTPINKTIEGRIREARSRMQRRQDGICNAQLDTDGLDEHVPLHPASRTFFAKVAETRDLSARGVQSLRRVARTLADLQGRKEVHEIHLAEALALRAPLFDQ